MKFRFSPFVILFFVIFLVSCGSGKSSKASTQGNQVRQYSVQSVLWQQNAAEYRALCYQAFNIAKLNLDEFLANETSESQKLAIVTDIDETVMDNSPFNAKLIEKNEQYTPKEWANWVNEKSAKPIPGATKFLKYAKSRGVAVFYVSNRTQDLEEATIQNMKAIDFPYADKEHLLLKTNDSAKRKRFRKVAQDHKIIMFMGDNLSDFSSDFRAPSTKKRNRLADQLEEHFGVDFIVLPNPMYGDWETRGIYEGKHWSEAQKDSIRKADLKTY